MIELRKESELMYSILDEIYLQDKKPREAKEIICQTFRIPANTFDNEKSKAIKRLRKAMMKFKD